MNDERYRELIQELLPCHSDGGGDVGNSSGYQESSISDLSDTDSLSDSQKVYSSCHRRRGKDRLGGGCRVSNSTSDSLSSSKADYSSSSKEGESIKKERRADPPPPSRKMMGGADHSSSSTPKELTTTQPGRIKE